MSYGLERALDRTGEAEETRVLAEAFKYRIGEVGLEEAKRNLAARIGTGEVIEVSPARPVGVVTTPEFARLRREMETMATREVPAVKGSLSGNGLGREEIGLAVGAAKSGPTVYVVADEAVTSLRGFHGFLSRLEPEDRVLIVGDARRRLAIGENALVGALRESGMPVFSVSGEVRERNARVMEATWRLTEGKTAVAVKTLTETGRVVAAPELERRAELAASFYAPDAGLVWRVTQGVNSRTFGSGLTRTCLYEYDARGRRVSETRSSSLEGIASRVSWSYDLANNVTETEDPTGRVVGYTYDPMNRLSQVTRRSGRMATPEMAANYFYRPNGLLDRLEYGDGSRSEYGYDSANRMTSVRNLVRGVEAERFEYGYDGAGNRLTETLTRNGQGFRVGTFVYDRADRLVKSTQGGRIQTWAYDTEGNRTGESITDSGTTRTRVYTYNDSNQLLSVTENGQPKAAFTYDLSGNVTSMLSDGVTWGYEFDRRQQLLRVTSQLSNGPPAVAGEYDYDVLKRRINRNGIWASYDGNDLLSEWTVADGQVNQLNGYVQGVGLVETTRDGKSFADSQGSVTLTENGTTAKRTEYGAFGEVRATDAQESSPGYTGQFFDKETGLQPLGNGERYYLPEYGRFLQEDSVVGTSAMPGSFNRYSYVMGNPFRYSDPTGNLAEGEEYETPYEGQVARGNAAWGELKAGGWMERTLGDSYFIPDTTLEMTKRRVSGSIFGLLWAAGKEAWETAVAYTPGNVIYDYATNPAERWKEDVERGNRWKGRGQALWNGVTTWWDDVYGITMLAFTDPKQAADLITDSAKTIGPGETIKIVVGAAADVIPLAGELKAGLTALSYATRAGVKMVVTAEGRARLKAVAKSVFRETATSHPGISPERLKLLRGAFPEAFAEAEAAGSAAEKLRILKKNGIRDSAERRALVREGHVCFVAGTPVQTANGLKNIEEIREGDIVNSYNEQTGKTEFKRVVRTFVNHTEELVAVTIAGEAKAIEATPTHPFFVKQARGETNSGDDDPAATWISAGELRPGDLVRTATGEWKPVVSVERRAESATVYNFEVEGNHTYFVGNKGVLVHNQCHPNLERGDINSTIVGGVPYEYAGHHLLPVSTAQKFGLTQTATRQKGVMLHAAELGYDINRARNGIALPTTDAEALLTNLPLHRGGHLGSYFRYVESKLTRLQRAFDTGKLSDDALLRSVGKIEDQIRSDLLRDRIRLQGLDPRAMPFPRIGP